METTLGVPPSGGGTPGRLKAELRTRDSAHPIDFNEFPDGSWIGNFTEELVILEATGIYQSFAGGHIHMVDRLEYSASGDNLIEHCFCRYSRKNGKP